MSGTPESSLPPVVEAEPAAAQLPEQSPGGVGAEAQASSPPSDAQLEPESASTDSESGTDADSAASRRRILIGSQRDPAAYRPKRPRDWEPVVEPGAPIGAEGEAPPQGKGREEGRRNRPRRQHGPGGQQPAPATPGAPQPRPPSVAPAESARLPAAAPAAPVAVAPVPAPLAVAPVASVAVQATSPIQPVAPTTPQPAFVSASAVPLVPPSVYTPAAAAPPPPPAPIQPPRAKTPPKPDALEIALGELAGALGEAVPEKPGELQPSGAPAGKVRPPSVRDRLTPDMEQDLQDALGGAAMDDLMSGVERVAEETPLEADSRQMARVVAVRRDDVFMELGRREQGILSLMHFPEPPQPGALLEVVVRRLNPEDGLYELALPNTSESVQDWSQVTEGMLVDAKVTGHNAGGLECEVNHLRGFIPFSQVAMYRVEDLAPFVGEQFRCMITEANPERQNLVLSRRAVLEKEREESRQTFRQTLEVGQIYEGTVRKLMDFGAFVELGSGVDGLLHVSQLSWARVAHPRDVLAEGQKISVRVERVDPDTGKISLAYRDLQENPWSSADKKFPSNSIVQGKVTKLMEFGAFVELEPGVEGLVHISELSHKRVWRTSDVVQEGQEVEVLVLSVDTQAQRMSLSMKALIQKPDPKKDKEKEEAALAESGPQTPPPPPKRQKPSKPLKGGLGRSVGGDEFGLKW